MISVIQNTFIITSFVIIMMLLVEYVTVLTKGKWSLPIQNKGWVQILLGTLLGLTPGCLGTYTVVTLYTHRIFGFPALIATMIATTGDEAFLMLSLMPKEALIINLILMGTAMLTGLAFWYFAGNKNYAVLGGRHLEIHDHEEFTSLFQKNKIISQFKAITFERAILIGAFILYIVSIITGLLEHNHGNLLAHGEHFHSNGHEHSRWNWYSITSISVSTLGLFIVSTTPDHFLHEHLWGHIIKKHFLKILLWSFAAMLLIHFGLDFLHIDNLIHENYLIILLLALLIGIIPESGPHIMFITLYLSGNIPFSILLANSVVQDGHGALPLFAESKKSFVYMKLVKIVLGIIAGVSGYYFGF